MALFPFRVDGRAGQTAQVRYPDEEESPLVAETIVRMGLSLVPFGSAIDIMLTDTRKRQVDRMRQTVKEVADAAGSDRLLSRLAESPESEAVFIQGIEAATRTGFEAKRRLLSRVVTAAILDDARINEGLLIVMALRDLDAPHLRALETIRRATEKVDAQVVATALEEGVDGPPPGQRIEQLLTVQIKADTPDLPSVVIAGLVREGALSPANTWDGQMGPTRPEHYRITEFGAALIEHLREVGA